MTADGTRSRAGAGPPPTAPLGRSPSDPIDEAIRRFQQGRGQDEAFRLLYETYFHPLQRFFARKGLSPEDCLDLTQETFLGIHRGLDGYEDRQRFVAWLYRVATTTFLKWRRAGATAKRGAVEVSRDAMENPDNLHTTPGRQLDELLAVEQQRTLAGAIAELPEQMRDCLTLRIHHQLAYREIALIKRVSIETVKAHLFRARKKLEERLGLPILDDLEG